MPKYLVNCTSGFAGVDEMVVVEADDDGEAETLAEEWWQDQVAPSVIVGEEISDEDAEEGGYQEIT